MSMPGRAPSVVEVRPEVVFLYELLQELTEGRLRIPRFQRPFVWRRDQMTDLLDSVYNQYPIGSLLVWETDESIATLDSLGPFTFPEPREGAVGYLIDGHQRLSTLAGALIAGGRVLDGQDQDPDRWRLAWNMDTGRFEHTVAEYDASIDFPLTSLLDTLRFFGQVDRVRHVVSDPETADRYIQRVSLVARSFQHYRVPVVRIRQTGLSEAVEIFARLNSKGQPMSADQMVSALTYRQGEQKVNFDLSDSISEIGQALGERGFVDVDRTTILRALLANIDEDIYKTDWTRLARSRREEMIPRLRDGVDRTRQSLIQTVELLMGFGVKTVRLLPYAMQLVVISAYVDQLSSFTESHRGFLNRWFWVSSFSGWFGFASTSRINSLVVELRRAAAQGVVPHELNNFDMKAMSLPFPSSFDMRSARTRTLLLVMLELAPRANDGAIVENPWSQIAERGPDAVGYAFSALPKELAGNPANRILRPIDVSTGQLRPWIAEHFNQMNMDILESYGIDEGAARAARDGNPQEFVRAREDYLIEKEHQFQDRVSVRRSDRMTGAAPVDTE